MRGVIFNIKIGAALCVGGVLLASSCAKAPKPVLSKAVWYWHTPFAVDDGKLKDLGVERVFVRGCTLSYDGEKLVPILRQQFVGKSAVETHLVYNFDAGALKHFEQLDNEVLAAQIVAVFASDKERAGAAGVGVSGLQFDFDVPTRLLPKYGDLAKRVRSKLKANIKLSATGLTTWFGSRDLRRLTENLDFYAPQFYEGHIPKSVGEDGVVGDLRLLERGMAQCERLGVPYFVGVPTYAQALLFDEAGHLRGSYKGLSLDDAFRHPSLRLESSRMEESEQRVQFVATQAGSNGKGKGYRIVYRIPTSQTVGKFWSGVQKYGGEHCLGIALFRYPERGESMALGLDSVLQAFKGQSLAPAFHATCDLRANPWTSVEGKKGFQYDLSLRLKNVGAESSAIGEGAVLYEVRFPVGALLELPRSAAVVPFAGDVSTAGKVSLARADGVVISGYRLGPGSSFAPDAITLGKKEGVTATWRVKLMDGSTQAGRFAMESRNVDVP